MKDLNLLINVHAFSLAIVFSDINGIPASKIIWGGGVYLINNNGPIQSVQVFETCTDVNNIYNQTFTTGGTGLVSQSGGGVSAMGLWSSIVLQNLCDYIILYPGYGIKAYASTGFSGKKVDIKNTTAKPIVIEPGGSGGNNIESFRLYYNDEELN